MPTKAAPLGPLDSEVEAEIRKCEDRINQLKRLKISDEAAYDQEVEKLQMISLEKLLDTETTTAMAESILIELDEPNPISSSREHVEAVLQNDSDEEFLGDSDVFVPFEDAVRSKEIPRDKL
jgi:hypothetical protein